MNAFALVDSEPDYARAASEFISGQTKAVPILRERPPWLPFASSPWFAPTAAQARNRSSAQRLIIAVGDVWLPAINLLASATDRRVILANDLRGVYSWAKEATTICIAGDPEHLELEAVGNLLDRVTRDDREGTPAPHIGFLPASTPSDLSWLVAKQLVTWRASEVCVLAPTEAHRVDLHGHGRVTLAMPDADIGLEGLTPPNGLAWSAVFAEGDGRMDSVALGRGVVCGDVSRLIGAISEPSANGSPRCAYGFGCYRHGAIVPAGLIPTRLLVLHGCGSAQLAGGGYDKRFSLALSAAKGIPAAFIGTLADQAAYGWELAYATRTLLAGWSFGEMVQSLNLTQFVQHGVPANFLLIGDPEATLGVTSELPVALIDAVGQTSRNGSTPIAEISRGSETSLQPNPPAELALLPGHRPIVWTREKNLPDLPVQLGKSDPLPELAHRWRLVRERHERLRSLTEPPIFVAEHVEFASDCANRLREALTTQRRSMASEAQQELAATIDSLDAEVAAVLVGRGGTSVWPLLGLLDDSLSRQKPVAISLSCQCGARLVRTLRRDPMSDTAGWVSDTCRRCGLVSFQSVDSEVIFNWTGDGVLRPGCSTQTTISARNRFADPVRMHLGFRFTAPTVAGMTFEPASTSLSLEGNGRVDLVVKLHADPDLPSHQYVIEAVAVHDFAVDILNRFVQVASG